MPASFHLFTASTLDSFSAHCRIFFDVLALKSRRRDYTYPSGLRNPDAAGLRLAAADARGAEAYHHLLTEFLLDGDRCGIYHVNEIRYLNLTPVLLDVLVNPQM